MIESASIKMDSVYQFNWAVIHCLDCWGFSVFGAFNHKEINVKIRIGSG